MNPVGKALWFMEAHFAEAISLEDIARVSGVSRFHLSRAFGLATGRTVMGYLRGRRLTEAAKRLAGGAPDILAVALDFGYGSHEAFTRAFRDEFGLTPERVRADGCVDNLPIVEAKRMDHMNKEGALVPRMLEFGPALIAGIGARYKGPECAGIPAQWQQFAPHIGHLPGQVGQAAYGVLHDGDGAGEIGYLCGVEVGDFSAVPTEFERLRLPKRTYAVFLHRGHITGIRGTWSAAWNYWAPGSGRRIADAPELERYTAAFDPVTGNGEVEIWIPVED